MFISELFYLNKMNRRQLLKAAAVGAGIGIAGLDSLEGFCFNGEIDEATFLKMRDDFQLAQDLRAKIKADYYSRGVFIKDGEVGFIDDGFLGTRPATIASVIFREEGSKLPLYGCEDMRLYQSQLDLIKKDRIEGILYTLEIDKRRHDRKKRLIGHKPQTIENYESIKKELEKKIALLESRSELEGIEYKEGFGGFSRARDEAYAENLDEEIQRRDYSRVLVIRGYGHGKQIQRNLLNRGFEDVYISEGFRNWQWQ